MNKMDPSSLVMTKPRPVCLNQLQYFCRTVNVKDLSVTASGKMSGGPLRSLLEVIFLVGVNEQGEAGKSPVVLEELQSGWKYASHCKWNGKIDWIISKLSLVAAEESVQL